MKHLFPPPGRPLYSSYPELVISFMIDLSLATLLYTLILEELASSLKDIMPLFPSLYRRITLYKMFNPRKTPWEFSLIFYSILVGMRGLMLYTWGQTLGQRVMKIQTVSRSIFTGSETEIQFLSLRKSFWRALFPCLYLNKFTFLSLVFFEFFYLKSFKNGFTHHRALDQMTKTLTLRTSGIESYLELKKRILAHQQGEEEIEIPFRKVG